jgi:DNA-binding cell septation regulator SpoVG
LPAGARGITFSPDRISRASGEGDLMALAAVALDDKYTLERGQVFLTGTQALARLP